MSEIHNSKTVALLTATALIAGCAGAVISATKEENRDTTGVYDGIWKVEVLKSAGKQNYGRWVMNCGDMRRSFNIQVHQGTMVMGANKKKVFVAPNGEFRSVTPLEHKASATGNSASTMSNGDMKVILTGKLGGEDAAGFFTFGIAELGYGGCTAETRYTKI